MNNNEAAMNEIPVNAYKNFDFLASGDARTLRILSEYLEPLSRLNSYKVNSTVLFLGSSRAESGNDYLMKYYREAEELAYRLARWAIKLKPKGKNFVICTGGGPGLMEAANRGASRAGGRSIGMNISLPEEQLPNPYISPELSFIFHYFFMRKFWLINRAKAVVAFPGGFGTLDELFETLTLIQTGKISGKDLAVILYGEEYWKKLINFDVLLSRGMISPQDVGLFSFCSTPKDALTVLKKNLRKSFQNAQAGTGAQKNSY
jgi:uncharacterized protein (TIGR00730 family)